MTFEEELGAMYRDWVLDLLAKLGIKSAIPADADEYMRRLAHSSVDVEFIE